MPNSGLFSTLCTGFPNCLNTALFHLLPLISSLLPDPLFSIQVSPGLSTSGGTSEVTSSLCLCFAGQMPLPAHAAPVVY